MDYGIYKHGMRAEKINMNISVSQCHFCLFLFHFTFRVKVTMGWKRISLELVIEGLLKDVVATSIVPVPLILLELSLYLAKHIMFYAELSWECSVKSVSISRPQSSTLRVRHLMIVQEMHFGQGQGMEAASGVLDWADWAVNCTLTHRAFWTSATFFHITINGSQ